jgi:predicted nucleotidyltransferase
MIKKHRPSSKAMVPRMYDGADVPMRVIRGNARKIAKRFHPDKIILFGSYAYGTPNADSDVDLLVIMPAYNQLSKARRIRAAFPASFAMDLIVRTPKNLGWRLAEGESFHTEIVSKGIVLHEKGDSRVGAKSRSRLEGRGVPHAPRNSPAACPAQVFMNSFAEP